MDALLIQPENKGDLDLLLKLLEKMNIEVSKLSEEELEDFGMAYLMKKGDRTKVSEKAIYDILK